MGPGIAMDGGAIDIGQFCLIAGAGGKRGGIARMLLAGRGC